MPGSMAEQLFEFKDRIQTVSTDPPKDNPNHPESLFIQVPVPEELPPRPPGTKVATKGEPRFLCCDEGGQVVAISDRRRKSSQADNKKDVLHGHLIPPTRLPDGTIIYLSEQSRARLESRVIDGQEALAKQAQTASWANISYTALTVVATLALTVGVALGVRAEVKRAP